MAGWERSGARARGGSYVRCGVKPEPVGDDQERLNSPAPEDFVGPDEPGVPDVPARPPNVGRESATDGPPWPPFSEPARRLSNGLASDGFVGGASGARGVQRSGANEP